MRPVAWIRCAALAGTIALLLPGVVAFGQEVRTLAEVMSGTNLRLTMKPADLPDTYKPVRLKSGSAGGGGLMDMFSAMLSPVAMILGSGQDVEGATLMGVADLSWTDGSVVKVQGKDFIVTYKWNLDLNAMSLQSKAEDQEKAKSDALKNMELSLTLVSVDGLTSITPVANFTKADLLKVMEMPIKAKPAEPATPPATLGDAVEMAPADAVDTGDPRLSALKELGTGMMMYVADYDDVFPYAQSTKGAQHASEPYYRTADCWKSQNPAGGQMLYNVSIGGTRQSEIPNLPMIVLFYDSKQWPDGSRGVVFADGHVSLLSDAEWKQVEPSLKSKLPKVGKPLPANYGLGGL